MEKYFAFEKLIVWEEAVDFASDIYNLTKQFPKHEQYGLISQIRRAATSISLNIAEGRGRSSTKDYLRFLYNSRGSLYEVITCLKISLKQSFIEEEVFYKFYNISMKLQLHLSRLIQSLENKI